MILLKEADISGWIRNMKSERKRVFTNCFQYFGNGDNEWEGKYSQQSLFIVNKDNGVNRLWFYTADFEDLQMLLQKELKKTEEYLIEIVAKDKNIYQDVLQKAGFCSFTAMMRMSNGNIQEIFEEDKPILAYLGGVTGEKASLSDLSAVKDLLWEIFDTRISHLPNDEELRTSITNGEFVIFKNENQEIVTLLQCVIKPGSFYINQVYNSAGKEVIHSILLSELKKYIELGGNYLYAWVEESNIASLKFHKKYGLSHDGLWDVIYIRRICEERRVS